MEDYDAVEMVNPISDPPQLMTHFHITLALILVNNRLIMISY